MDETGASGGIVAERPNLMSLNDTKAGMTGLDKDKINKIIQEASQNTPYYKHQTERQKKLDAQVENMMTTKDGLTRAELEAARKEMDAIAATLEHKRRDLSRINVHVDMDMFYAAVETRENPSLADVPMAVGTMSMLSTSNYLARKFGVRAGMAGFIAKKLCPSLRIIKHDFTKYVSTSKEVMSVLSQYDPSLCAASLDEAYMDITDYVTQRFVSSGGTLEVDNEDPFTLVLPEGVWDLAGEVVIEMRQAVCDKTKLTCSAGIAHNKMFAKVCSDLNKPNGQFMLKATSLDIVQEFLDKTAVRKIGGIGPVQEQFLKALDIYTIKDLYEKRDFIYLLFTPSSIQFYLRVSLGVGSNRVSADGGPRKSKGAETTFAKTNSKEVLNKHLDDLSKEVAEDLKKANLRGKTVTLRIKWSSFKVNVKSKTLNFYTADADIIYNTVRRILFNEMLGKSDEDSKIRLVGVRLSNFEGDRAEYEGSSDDECKVLNDKSNGKRSRQTSMLAFVKKTKSDQSSSSLMSNKSLIDNNRNHSLISISHGFDFMEDSNYAEIDCDNFMCSSCHADFATIEKLEEHMNNCTAVDSTSTRDAREVGRTSSVSLLPSVKEIPDYICPVCNIKKSSLAQLHVHIEGCLKD